MATVRRKRTTAARSNKATTGAKTLQAAGHGAVALGTGTSIAALRRTGRTKESSILSTIVAVGGFAGQIFSEEGSPMQGISRTAASAAISAGMGDMLAQRILNASGLENEEFDYDQQYEETPEFDHNEAHQPHLESVEEPVLVRPIGGNNYVRQGSNASVE